MRSDVELVPCHSRLFCQAIMLKVPRESVRPFVNEYVSRDFLFELFGNANDERPLSTSAVAVDVGAQAPDLYDDR